MIEDQTIPVAAMRGYSVSVGNGVTGYTRVTYDPMQALREMEPGDTAIVQVLGMVDTPTDPRLCSVCRKRQAEDLSGLMDEILDAGPIGDLMTAALNQFSTPTDGSPVSESEASSTGEQPEEWVPGSKPHHGQRSRSGYVFEDGRGWLLLSQTAPLSSEVLDNLAEVVAKSGRVFRQGSHELAADCCVYVGDRYLFCAGSELRAAIAVDRLNALEASNG